MGFLAPWFLAGAAAIGLPVYLHLLRRHRAIPRPFSSLMFFERRLESSVRHRRLRHLVLLALRVALLLLVVLAFADPFINRAAASAEGRKLLLLVIDNSFSMRAGSRLADARRAALSLLASRRPSGRAEVMTLGSGLTALTKPTRDTASLRAAVQRVQATDSRATFDELAHTVRSLAQATQTPIELHLFSDVQRTAMPANFDELALPGNVSLAIHNVAGKDIADWTVASIDAPGRVSNPRGASVRAVIAGYHTPAAIRTASLIINGNVTATKKIEVPANGRATVTFPSLDVPYGLSRCAVKIDSADALPADDLARFGVVRADPEPVLFVHQPGDSRSPLYFGAALESAAKAEFKLQAASVDQLSALNPSAYAFTVLSDVYSLPPSFASRLVKYLSSGGSVLVAAGTSVARSASIPAFGGRVFGSHDYSRDGSHFMRIGPIERSHATLLSAGWRGVKFYFVVRTDPTNAQVIARLGDGTPLLLEKRVGAGRVLLFASGLDNLTNDFPLHPAFVPFIEQTARYLSGLERQGGSQIVGTWVEMGAGSTQAAPAEVIGPGSTSPAALNSRRTPQSVQLTRAGFYEFHRSGGPGNIIGVNPDIRESDLAPMPADLLALWRGGGGTHEKAAGGRSRRGQVQPYRLWWYVMLVALLAAVAESLFAGRYLRELREEP